MIQKLILVWMKIKNRFEYMLLIQAISRSWKTSINDFPEYLNNLIIQDQDLIKSQQICCASRLTCKEIYDTLMANNLPIPSFQQYYNTLFSDTKTDWKSIYILPSIVSLETKVRIFQKKLLNNTFYLKKKYVSNSEKLSRRYVPFAKQQTKLHQTNNYFMNAI